MNEIKIAKELIKLAKSLVASDIDEQTQARLDEAQYEGKKYILYQKVVDLWVIQACTNFSDVKKGDFGGFIKSEKNLSHKGDCWVYRKSMVDGDAQIFGNAKVSDGACVSDKAMIYENAHVFGQGTKVYDGAWVSGWETKVYGGAKIYDDAKVCGGAQVYGGAKVYGDAQVCGGAQVYDGAQVCGESYVQNRSKIHGKVKVDYDVDGKEITE